MITRMDGDVGRITALLDELGLTDNTLLLFCSDNGAANRYDGVFDSSGPLRGLKQYTTGNILYNDGKIISE
jgi:arylsulfatase A-like enzyme